MTPPDARAPGSASPPPRRARSLLHPRRWLPIAGSLLLAAWFVVAFAIIVLQYWVLPRIGNHAEAIQQAVSEALGERVSIGNIGAHWSGLRAELDLEDVRLYDAQERPALQLPAVHAVIGWRSLLYGSVQLHSLIVDRPDLQIRRDAQGRIEVGGRYLTGGESGGSSAWLFSQPELLVRGARLEWTDELRAAPKLSLTGVDLVIRNSGNIHKLALRATAPPELASTLDVRLTLQGEAGTDMLDWKGRAFAELGYVDLAAWKRWVDYPLEVESGRGALRVWASFEGRRLTQATADLALAQLATRLAPGLPMLELETLRGRVGAKEQGERLAVSARSIELKLAREEPYAAGGFDLQWEPRKVPAGEPAAVQGSSVASPVKGEFHAEELALEPIAKLSAYLPLPVDVRRRLVDLEPRGKLQDLTLAWSETAARAADPAEGKTSADAGAGVLTYAVRGRFAGIGINRYGEWGGFEGLSGSIDATQAQGSLRLDSQNAVLDAARRLPEPLQFESLVAGISWKRVEKPGEPPLRVSFTNVSAANRELAGTAHGTWSAAAEGPGNLDLTASLTRGDGRALWRYIPLLPATVADYLKAAIDGGTLSDGQLRFKGDIRDFPFADAKHKGVFQVSARIANGELEYASRWPRITGIAGELRIEGPRLQVSATRGAILGTRLANVRAQLADFHGGDERVRVEGTAEGPVPEFLRFIEQSPVSEMIGGATRGMNGSGPGRLQLGLELPLRRLTQTKVSGAFQFAGNPFTFDPALPPLSQLNGRLDFTDEGVSARGLTAQFLGGPSSFSIARADRTYHVSAQGSATIAAVQRAFDLDWLLQRASGASAWTATATLGAGGRFDLQVDSPLSGVAIALPAPLGKRAGEPLPFRFERSNRADAELIRRVRGAQLTAGGDAMAFTAGRVASGVILRRRGTEGWSVDRGAIGINEPPPPLEGPGLSLAGTFPVFDLDRWRTALTPPSGPASASPVTTGPATTGPATTGQATTGQATASRATAAVSSIRLNAVALDIGGKRLNDVHLRASPLFAGAVSAWSASISARELEGALRWDEGEGSRGRIAARLKRLSLPESSGEPAAAESPGSELPALDIVADAFQLGDKALGRLELVAQNESRNWKIEKLVLSTSDATLNASGVWQSWATRPSVSLNLKLDVADIGQFFNRVGFPNTMRGGTATLEGRVGWVGAPQSIDYPTLTGDVKVSAAKGQFLKAEPGIAKLLGVLSLQSWISLDFREALGEGFIFDSLSSNARIVRGVLSTEDFDMNGKSAHVTMAGTVDLARETQNLRAKVVPAVGDSASTVVGLLLANPVTGLGAMLAQRLLRDPLGKIFTVEYTVTGGWTEPKVQRVRAETAQSGGTDPVP